MGADYDQKDARGFINLIGLPIQVRALQKKTRQRPRRREKLAACPHKGKKMKLWGGRFETGPSEVFERFSALSTSTNA
jgi:hypothetical protein